jgi:transcriptional regulator with PAS, ATPase and Fis domain
MALAMQENTRTALPDAMSVRAAKVEVRGGCDTGKEARIDKPTFVIGSGENADLRLDDATVSREHVRLALTPEGVMLKDGGSKNGTWVGGIRVHHALLTADALVTIGATTLAFRIESGSLELPISGGASFGEAQGVSTAMRHVFALLERFSPSDATILLEGESGVGKEVLARSIHQRSRRAHGPFVAVDCGAIPPGLIESELFGHVRGAFTGAMADREGLFAQADGGTLFLDEVGELPLDLQPKLLRALERREIRAVGSRSQPRAIDVRVVAATNRRLGEMASRGEFRPDLFYRLAVARVTVPPLRDRPEDIVPLARSFLRTKTHDARSDVPGDVAAMLTGYDWPGNVRELRNVVERYLLLGAKDPRALFDGAQALRGGGTDDFSHMPYHEARAAALDRFERGYAPRVLARAGGVVVRAAEIAEMGRASFYRMLDRVRASTGEHPAVSRP